MDKSLIKFMHMNRVATLTYMCPHFTWPKFQTCFCANTNKLHRESSVNRPKDCWYTS